ncbi:ThiJ PfpI domain-containing protein [Coniophora puteana RWD-64-598 SS2]|uniref:D-lactate dehydratase n=1 Tax=Coniophora puteana (strain RWD-64-598) TaxID=741705 RepID=A0A5M3MWK8_CONPW|nr:ThiJ PfpI domain-containing protein [Coniophora puteana RWD-64-598 SS2]EIW83450.1 ThiJ PfpI domain-containing protein [Coniophora puteana RWD-64-598 SS2]
MTTTKRVLFVLSSATETLTGAPAGWYLPEAAHPYYVLAADPGISVDFAAPKGPNPPVDPASVQGFPDDIPFLSDPAPKRLLETARVLATVSAADYDAVFYVGGHGPMMDLAADEANAKLLMDFWNANKIVSAVCHGPGAMVLAKLPNGDSILKGKNVTGLSNAEEEAIGKTKDVPFLLEDKLRELGSKYTLATKPFENYVVVDNGGKLITGQNPASAKEVGQKILEALKA